MLPQNRVSAVYIILSVAAQVLGGTELQHTTAGTLLVCGRVGMPQNVQSFEAHMKKRFISVYCINKQIQIQLF